MALRHFLIVEWARAPVDVRFDEAAGRLGEAEVAREGVGAQVSGLEVLLAQLADVQLLLRPAAFLREAFLRIELLRLHHPQLWFLGHAGKGSTRGEGGGAPFR